MATAPKGAEGITPAQALYIVDRLLREGKITRSVVDAMVRSMSAEMREIETRLAMLRGTTPPSPRRAGRRRGNAVPGPEVTASRRIQGQYLGLIRQIPANERGRFKKIAAEEGREAAIRKLRVALQR